MPRRGFPEWIHGLDQNPAWALLRLSPGIGHGRPTGLSPFPHRQGGLPPLPQSPCDEQALPVVRESKRAVYPVSCRIARPVHSGSIQAQALHGWPVLSLSYLPRRQCQRVPTREYSGHLHQLPSRSQPKPPHRETSHGGSDHQEHRKAAVLPLLPSAPLLRQAEAADNEQLRGVSLKPVRNLIQWPSRARGLFKVTGDAQRRVRHRDPEERRIGIAVHIVAGSALDFLGARRSKQFHAVREAEDRALGHEARVCAGVGDGDGVILGEILADQRRTEHLARSIQGSARCRVDNRRNP